MGPVGAYPGTFDPPTVAHLAIAEAAWRQAGLGRVELIVSRHPLGKAPLTPRFEERIAVLEQVCATRSWLSVVVTEHRLIADVVRGYDAVVLGADKWLQVLDPAWYGGSGQARDQALRSLPRVLVAPRSGAEDLRGPIPIEVLDVQVEHREVSSTLVRDGRVEWMLPEAAAFDARTGAWSNPRRYLADGR